DSLRKYVEPYLEADLLRTTWDIDYKIEAWEPGSDYYRLVTASVYEMENRSSSPKDFTFRYEVEKSLFPQVGETVINHVKITNLLDDGKEPLFHYDSAVQSDTKPSIDEVEGMHFIEKSVSIPASNGPAYRFSFDSIECFHNGSIVPFF